MKKTLAIVTVGPDGQRRIVRLSVPVKVDSGVVVLTPEAHALIEQVKAQALTGVYPQAYPQGRWTA